LSTRAIGEGKRMVRIALGLVGGIRKELEGGWSENCFGGGHLECSRSFRKNRRDGGNVKRAAGSGINLLN